MARFQLISLGCAKNLVDSEVMLGSMASGGWELVDNPDDADLLLLNTCGFIQPAVEEAIGEILALVSIKQQSPEKRIVVVGCLVQRYKQGLVEEIPEVDLFLGTEAASGLVDYIARLVNGELVDKILLPERSLMNSYTPRILSTPFFRAWLKITEGCDNRCSYCMIPTIRGPLRSRSIEDIVLEAQNLQNFGVKEISLVAQDSTAYGNDLDNGHTIVQLIKQLLKNTAIPWLRLLYLYPTGIHDELLQLMAENPRILPYLDIPIQHVSDTILHAMNRRYSQEALFETIGRIRTILPDIALRTTVLVGFPGETESDFLQLETFLKTMRLDHVGVFPYANEEGCVSESFSDQLPEEEKARRCEHLLSLQAELSEENQKKYLGRVEPVLVEGVSRETDLLLEGRTRYQAAEVDGCVYINEGFASPGDIVQVQITETQVYDLVGGIVGPYVEL